MIGLNQEIKFFKAEKIIWPFIYILCFLPLIVGFMMVFEYPGLYFKLLTSGYGLVVLAGFIFLVTTQYILMKMAGDTFFDNLGEYDQMNVENRPSRKINGEYLKLSLKLSFAHGFFGMPSMWVIALAPFSITITEF